MEEGVVIPWFTLLVLCMYIHKFRSAGGFKVLHIP